MARGKTAGNKGQGSKWCHPTTRLAIYLRDNLQCVYCLAKLEHGTQLTLDHVRPRSAGGTNAARNLVTACMSCNRLRGDTRLADFLLIHIVPVKPGYPEDHECDLSDAVARVRNATRRKLPRELARTLVELRKKPGDLIGVVVDTSERGFVDISARYTARLAGPDHIKATT
jgi:hypothetical protein